MKGPIEESFVEKKQIFIRKASKLPKKDVLLLAGAENSHKEFKKAMTKKQPSSFI